MDGAGEDLRRVDAAPVRRECAVSGCDRPTRSTGAPLCEGHYTQRHKGKPFTELRPRRIEGDACAIEGCTKPRTGKYCGMHRARLARHGDPDKVIHQRDRALPRGENHPMWVADPDYRQWHQRLRQIKGRASDHPCAMGCGAQAAQWAYVGARDADDRRPYEIDANMYAALCARCHKNMDRAFQGFIPQPRRRGVPWLDQAITLYEGGMGCVRIGREVERSAPTVWRALVKAGVQMRKPLGRCP